MINIMQKITESTIEQFTIELLEKSGYQYIYGPDIAPDSQTPERRSFEDVLLIERLNAAVARVNPNVPADAREDAVKQLLRLNSPELISNNESFHRMLTEGINVSYQKDGNCRGDLVWLIDFNDPENNDFLVLNQYTVIENHVNKRPDVVLFVNGLPLIIIELKNPADENATIHSAFQQVQTYMQAIPGLFVYSGFIVISDGLEARAGTISSGFSRFMAWKTADGKVEASPLIGQLETLIKGMLGKNTLLDLIRHFIVFERKAVQKQPSLSPSQGEGGHYRGGMNFSGMINQVRELRKNQTKAEEIFWELVRNKGFLGLKFRRQHQIGHYIVDFYCHSERLIIEFDGEVHDTSEQRKKDEKRDKYLKSLGNKVLRFRNAELIKDTENVLQVIVKSLSPPGRDGREGGVTIGRDGREGGITIGREGLAKWTQLESLIGSADRIRQVAQDIVIHFEQRQEVSEGKGMIVTMSRRIAAALYAEIIKIRPQWHDDDLRKGVIKVVMTSSSSDGPAISRHYTTKEQRRVLADRMKNPEDELRLVIVRDMWLTGFDVPCLHTLYIDKPMRGHNLMQAIARVNRVYKDKTGCLIARFKKNLIQGKSLMEMLENSIRKYHNKILTAADIIEELIKLSKEIKEMDKEPREMGLSDFEYAFYTAIANNESARQVMAKAKLRELAVVLYEKVRENASIDWTIKESVKAKLKVIVKRILRQYGYPPEGLKAMFKNKEIEIVVCEAGQGEEDETAYLLKSSANRERLLKAIENAAHERNLMTVKVDELQ